MPQDVTFSRDPTDFDDAFVLDWTDHPQQGPVGVPQVVDTMLQGYHFNEGTVSVDIGGPPVSLSRCSVHGFNFNFASGDPVLLGDNLAGKLPVHLTFNPPVRAVGTQVSASGPVGHAYLAQFAVRLADGTWRPCTANATLNRKRGTAPFVGALAADGVEITEAWFDVVDVTNQVDFVRVAINQLYWVPI